MRKPKFSILVIITILFVAFTMGYFLGISQKKSQITVSVTNEITTLPTETIRIEQEIPQVPQIAFPIPINHAKKEDLAALPGIGDVLAQRIIDYRTIHGNFTSAEDLLNVEGIGTNRLEEILDLIVIGG